MPRAGASLLDLADFKHGRSNETKGLAQNTNFEYESKNYKTKLKIMEQYNAQHEGM